MYLRMTRPQISSLLQNRNNNSINNKNNSNDQSKSEHQSSTHLNPFIRFLQVQIIIRLEFQKLFWNKLMDKDASFKSSSHNTTPFSNKSSSSSSGGKFQKEVTSLFESLAILLMNHPQYSFTNITLQLLTSTNASSYVQGPLRTTIHPLLLLLLLILLPIINNIIKWQFMHRLNNSLPINTVWCLVDYEILWNEWNKKNRLAWMILVQILLFHSVTFSRVRFIGIMVTTTFFWAKTRLQKSTIVSCFSGATHKSFILSSSNNSNSNGRALFQEFNFIT